MTTKNDFKKIQEELATLNGINNECVEANTKLKAATEENLKYLNENSSLKGQLKNMIHLQRSLQIAKQQLKTKIDKISSLENANVMIDTQNRNYVRDNSILKTKLSKLEKDISILNEKLKANTNVDSAIQEVNEDHRRLVEKGVEHLKQISELELGMKELSEKYNNAQHNVALAELEKKKNKELKEKTESILMEEKSKYEKAKDEIFRLNENLRELREDVQTKRNDRAEKGVQTCLKAKIAAALSSKCDTSTNGTLLSMKMYY